jgi:hypothetical protein
MVELYLHSLIRFHGTVLNYVTVNPFEGYVDLRSAGCALLAGSSAGMSRVRGHACSFPSHCR